MEEQKREINIEAEKSIEQIKDPELKKILTNILDRAKHSDIYKDPNKRIMIGEPIEEEKGLMRIDVNIEKMPIVFFGSKEKKRALEKQIFESGKPYEISSVTSEDGSIVKKLSIAPNAAFGLPTGFDQDIIVVVFYHLYDLNKKLGYCPRKIRIPLSDFPKIMEISKGGKLYKGIEISAERVSGCEIYQDKFVTVKEKNGKLKIYEKTSLKLFHFNGIHKEEKITQRGKKIKKYYLDLEIPEWVANNIENLYTTEFDVKKYFLAKGGRTRKLYRFLEFIRYNKTVPVSYEKLKEELWIDEKETYHFRQALKRSFIPLVKSDYLTDFKFDEYGVVVTFSSIKKRKAQIQLTFEEMARQESLASMMLEKLGDTHSENFYRKVAQKYPEDLIHKCLSLTREVIETQKIKKTKGAVFTDILKREGEKIGIALS